MFNPPDILNAQLLVVDDEHVHVFVLESMLREAGYTSVTSTMDSHQVCELHRANHYDLILLDIQMPGADGFQVMEGLKEIEVDGDLPVLVIAGKAGEKLRALRAGAKDFVSKPFDPAEVLARVRNLLKIRLLYKQVRNYSKVLEQTVQERTADLQKSEQRFRSFMQHLPGAAFMKDLEGRYIYVNPGAEKVIGKAADAIVGHSTRDMFPAVYAELSISRDHDVVSAGDATSSVDEIPTAEGTRLFLTHRFPISGSDGHLAVVGGIALDITERINAERALHSSETRFRMMWETTTDAIVILNETGHIRYANPAFRDVFGYESAEVVGKEIGVIQPAYLRAAHSAGFARYLQTGKKTLNWRSVETIGLHRSGREIPVEIVFTEMEVDGKPGFAGFIRDISDRKLAAQALHLSEERLRSISEASREWIWETDVHGKYTLSNYAVESILGYTPEEVMGKNAVDLLCEEDQQAAIEWQQTRTEKRNRGWHNLTLRWRHKDGSQRWLESNALPLLAPGGEFIGYRGADRDITERIQQQEKIAGLSRIHAVLSGINTMIVRVSDRQELLRGACRIAVEQGRFTMAWIGLAEPGAAKVRPVAWSGVEAGYLDNVGQALATVNEDEGVAGRALREKKPVVANDVETDPKVIFKQEALSRGYRSLVALPLMVEGAAIGVMVLYASTSGFFYPDEMKLLTALADDISFALDHIAKGERLAYFSYYDALTELPNRQLFSDRITQLTKTADAEGRPLAVLIVDPQRFRNINDTFGRGAGDLLLKQLAQHLRETVGESCSPARIGADQFAFATSGMDTSELILLVQRYAMRLQLDQFVIGGVELRIAIKIGIAQFPADGEDAETLLRNAEAALERAKDTADIYLFYSREMNARVAQRLHLESRLRRAIEKQEFLLHYQPKFDLQTRQIQGLEALIRWNDPERGLISPLEFIPVLEDTGMILEVGWWVVKQSLADRRLWQERGLEAPRVAVNVSQLQLRRKEFVATILSALGGAAGEAAGIDLEITESLIMEDTQASIEKLRELRAAGMRIYMDDFGTGYSSLSQIAQLPLDALKIDRAFIKSMDDKTEHMTIVSTIISLAHALKISVVAEGVETETQADLLRSLGCNQVQGYLFGRPQPAEETAKLLRAAIGATD